MTDGEIICSITFPLYDRNASTAGVDNRKAITVNSSIIITMTNKLDRKLKVMITDIDTDTNTDSARI